MSIRFFGGFSAVTAVLTVLNALSYSSQRIAYYKFLNDSGWTWAGHWTWGFPFPMVMAGLGHDNHSQVEPMGFVLNILVWLTLGGLVGIACDAR